MLFHAMAVGIKQMMRDMAKLLFATARGSFYEVCLGVRHVFSVHQAECFAKARDVPDSLERAVKPVL
ncbi:hypothetical protein C6503_11710 [Candidatus Poribacteria bacterium]|nr:MAG: hypothetical protein C6503_11710 [Candidatus Poribacteria bacterium]